MKRNLSFFIMALLLPLALTACAAADSNSNQNSQFDLSGSLTPTATPVASCSTATAQIAALNLTNGTVAAGTSVLWQVTASGCANFKLVRSGQAALPFTSSVSYTNAYPFPSTGLYEVVTVQAIDASGAVAKEITVTSSMFVVSASGSPSGTNPLTCSVGGPYTVSIPVNAYGSPIGAYPTVSVAVTSNRASTVTGFSNPWGSVVVQSGVPDYSATGIHNPQVVVYGYGTNQMVFEVTDAANSSIKATCTGIVNLSTVYTPPAQCSLVADRYAVSPGGAAVFTLTTTSGTATAGTIEGVSVSPNGGTRSLVFSTSTTVHATVTSASGTSSCTAAITVTQDTVGVNFEDWTDFDYNDAVLCMNGYLQVSGKQILSHAYQTIYAQRSAISACDSTVTVRVKNQYGLVVNTISYSSMAANGSAVGIYLQPGWAIETVFTPNGLCASVGTQSQLTSNRIAVGNYCNSTGN